MAKLNRRTDVLGATRVRSLTSSERNGRAGMKMNVDSVVYYSTFVDMN